MVYEFGDGSAGSTGILRKANGEPSLRLWSRSTADTPNRFSVEFQDAFNEYQQDSLSLVQVEDVAQTGQEISGPFTVLGLTLPRSITRLWSVKLWSRRKE